MRVTSKGQVTIPIEIRRALDIGPETELVFDVVDGSVRIRKLTAVLSQVEPSGRPL